MIQTPQSNQTIWSSRTKPTEFTRASHKVTLRIGGLQVPIDQFVSTETKNVKTKHNFWQLQICMEDPQTFACVK